MVWLEEKKINRKPGIFPWRSGVFPVIFPWNQSNGWGKKCGKAGNKAYQNMEVYHWVCQMRYARYARLIHVVPNKQMGFQEPTPFQQEKNNIFKGPRPLDP